MILLLKNVRRLWTFQKCKEKTKKKIIILTFFTLFTSNLLAETGKFNASGMGSWEMNVMNAGNGNMSITYDGNAGLSDKEDGLSLIHI